MLKRNIEYIIYHDKTTWKNMVFIAMLITAMRETVSLMMSIFHP